MKAKPLRLAPHQVRPLIFDVTLSQQSSFNFSVEIAYKTEGGNETTMTPPFGIGLTERLMLDAQKLTFLHPAGVVSYAIIRPPPASGCSTPSGGLPVLLSLHGAGLEADSKLVREMLNAAYGVCAWMVFPTGGTPWSGDDWRKTRHSGSSYDRATLIYYLYRYLGCC